MTHTDNFVDSLSDINFVDEKTTNFFRTSNIFSSFSIDSDESNMYFIAVT